MKPIKVTPFYLLAFAATLSLTVIGCNRDKCDPGEDCHNHEQELITKLAVTLSDSSTGAAVSIVEWDDADGPGGNSPVIDSIVMDPSKTYLAALSVFGSHDGHSDDITTEILAEDDEHIFCFTVTSAPLTVTRTDTDGTHEVGLASKWRTSTSGTGTLRITLKHQPEGVKDGTCTPGDTDIEVDFPVRIR